MVLYSASFPYYACPEDTWRDRFTKIRDAGFQAVESFVPWNWHEPSAPPAPGDYSGMNLSALHAWLRMAHEEFGLHTILRPDPGGSPGWWMGGWPAWLRSVPPFSQPEAAAGEISDARQVWIRHWYRAFARAVAPEQITQKNAGQAGVILIGVDPDPTDPPEIERLIARIEYLREFGLELPLFTTHPWPRDAPPPPPMTIVTGWPEHPRILPEQPANMTPEETTAAAAARLDLHLRQAFSQETAWVNLRPFVASSPPPGWQDPALDDAAMHAPIAPDGVTNELFDVARAAGHRMRKMTATKEASNPDEAESPPSPSPDANSFLPLPDPLAIARIQIQADDPTRAGWMERGADSTPSSPSRVFLYRLAEPPSNPTPVVRVTYPRGDALEVWRNGSPITPSNAAQPSEPEFPDGGSVPSAVPDREPPMTLCIPTAPANSSEPDNLASMILRHTDRRSTRMAVDPSTPWGVRSLLPLQWAPEPAGVRERWYAPSLREEGWSNAPADTSGAHIACGTPAPYAIWARVDFATPEAGFAPDVSWSATFRMTEIAAGGIAYLNGRPLRGLPEHPGDVRILFPNRALHAEPGARNTLTLLVFPIGSIREGGRLIEGLRIVPFRRR